MLFCFLLVSGKNTKKMVFKEEKHFFDERRNKPLSFSYGVVCAAASLFGVARDAFADTVLYVMQGGVCGGFGQEKTI